MRAAVYARLSQVDKDEAGRVVQQGNLDQQIALGRAEAIRRGWEIVGEYIEPGRSGFHDTARKVWPKVLAEVEAGRIDVVIVRHLDRLYRDEAKAIAFSRFCNVVAYDQGVDTTKEGWELSFGIYAVLGAEESRTKSKRSKAHRERMRAAGRPRSGGPRAYGFDPDGMTVRPTERALIQKSARMIAEGSTLRSVAKLWADEGVQNSRGRPVARVTVREVLLAAERHGVDPEIAKRVRAILTDPRRRKNGTGANRKHFLLTGLIYCGKCGRRMYGDRMSRAHVPYYRCDARCNAIRADALEAFVWRQVAIIQRFSEGRPDADEAALSEEERALREAVDVEKARAANKRRDYTEDLIDGRTLKDALTVIEKRTDELRRRLADIALQRAREETVHDWIKWYASLQDGPSEDFDRMRLMVETAVERVTVQGEDVSIEFDPGWGTVPTPVETANTR